MKDHMFTEVRKGYTKIKNRLIAIFMLKKGHFHTQSNHVHLRLFLIIL